MLSKACQYGIKSVIFISAKSKEKARATLKDVADAIDSPPAFTSKILQQLVAAQIITSSKGSGGGFSISDSKMKSVKLLAVINIFEGNHFSTDCLLGFPKCSDKNPCPIHYLYAPIRAQMNNSLYAVSINQIVVNSLTYSLKL